MIYVVSNIKLPMGNVPTVMFIKDGVNYYSLPQILTDENISNKMSFDLKSGVSLYALGGMIFPVVIKETDADNVISITGEDELEFALTKLEDENYLICMTNDFNELEEFKDAPLTKSLYKELLINASICIDAITNNSFYYLINPKNYNSLKDTIITYNRNTKGEKINYTQIKEEASKNSTEDSELNIEVPDVYYIPNDQDISEDEDEDSTIDENTTSEYKRYMSNIQTNIYDNIRKITPYGVNPLNIDMSAVESLNSLSNGSGENKSILAGIPKGNIYGMPNNNDIPLRESEEKFYNKLNNMIDEFYKSYAIAQGLSQDVIKNQIEHSIVPKQLLSIFESFIRLGLNLNWRHCYYVSLSDFDGIDGGSSASDDDTDKGDESQSDTNQYAVSRDVNMSIEEKRGIIIDMLKVANELVSKVKGTTYAYSEIIVKLLRWGSVKPNKIYINFTKSVSAPNTSFYIDMEIGTIGNDIFTSIYKRTKKNGYDANIVSLVTTPRISFNTSESQIELFNQLGLEPIVELPETIIGVAINEFYTSGEQDIEKLNLMDLRTFKNKLMNTNLKFDLINYDKETKSFNLNKELDTSSLGRLSVSDAYSIKTKAKTSQLGFELDIENLQNQFSELTVRELRNLNLVDFSQSLLRESEATISYIILDSIDSNLKARVTVLNEMLKYFIDIEENFDEDEEKVDLLNCLNTYQISSKTEEENKVEAKDITNHFSSVDTSAKFEKVPVKLILKATDDYKWGLIQGTKTQYKAILLEQKSSAKYDLTEAKEISGLKALKNMYVVSQDPTGSKGIEASEDIIESLKNFIRTALGLQNFDQLKERLLKVQNK